MRIAVVLGACSLCATAAPITAADPPPARPSAPSPSAPSPSAPSASSPPSTGTAGPAPAAEPLPRYRIVAFDVRGESKVKPRILGYLAHTAIGDLVDQGDIPKLEQALLSSELFKTVAVTLESAPGDPSPGVILVATVTDKHSWIAAPTVFALPGNTAFGVGFAENNFRGLDQKFLLYGQLGTHNSFFFGTFLDPAVHGSQLTWRTDLYIYRRDLNEYANPPGDARSTDIARTTSTTYFGVGALVGWNFTWWLVGDLRLRGAYAYFRDSRDANDQPLPVPEKDGWDVTLQAHLTIDHRHHRYGVTWGSYLQLTLEPSVPLLDSYGYQNSLLRAYHSWRLFQEHEFELRGQLGAGRHMPAHEELTIGGTADLRGYNVDQFRGDLRAAFRAEYSIPLFKWRFLAFRAIGFYDAGYVGFHSRRPGDRDYLPNQLTADYGRSNVGTGLRIYLDNIVLPLLGFDLAYGIEGHSPEIYFEVGLTDF